MRPGGWPGLLGVVVVSACVLASCGLVEGALGEDDAGPQTALVSVLVPGGAAGSGVADGVVAAVELAVRETTSDISGWTVEVEVVDEGADAAATSEAAEAIVESDAVAVVGGLSTPAIRAAQPILDDAELVFVSPADLDPAHTRGSDPAAPLRPYLNYYRTSVATETPLGVLARYAVTGRGATTITVIDCGDADTAQRFAAEARQAGGTVPAIAAAGSGGSAVPAAVAAAKKDGAKAIFVAGGPERAAMVAEEVAATGLDVPILAAPELRDTDFLELAGAAGADAVSVVPATLESTLEAEPESLVTALAESGSRAALGPFGAAAHDAAVAVGTALAHCLPPAATPSSARRGCAGELIEMSFAGSTGEVAFDDFGERVGGTSEIMVVREGRWTKVTVS